MDPQKPVEFPGSKPLPPIGSGSESQEGDKKSSETDKSRRDDDDRSSSSTTAFHRPGEGSARPAVVRGFRPEVISDDEMDDEEETPRIETTRRKTYDGRELVFVSLDTQTDWDWVEAVEDQMGSARAFGSEGADRDDKDRATASPKSAGGKHEGPDDRGSSDPYQYQMPYNDEYGIPILDLSSDTDDKRSAFCRFIKPSGKYVKADEETRFMPIVRTWRDKHLSRGQDKPDPRPVHVSRHQDYALQSGSDNKPPSFGKNYVPPLSSDGRDKTQARSRDTSPSKDKSPPRSPPRKDNSPPGKERSPTRGKRDDKLGNKTSKLGNKTSKSSDEEVSHKKHKDSRKFIPSVGPPNILQISEERRRVLMGSPSVARRQPPPGGAPQKVPIYSVSRHRRQSISRELSRHRQSFTSDIVGRAGSKRRFSIIMPSVLLPSQSVSLKTSSVGSELDRRVSVSGSQGQVSEEATGERHGRAGAAVVLPSRTPSKSYQRESEKHEISADDPEARLEGEEFDKDECGVTHGIFSGKCEFCNQDIKPFPTPEQQSQYPPESLYCCADYREFVEFVLLTNNEMEEEIRRKNKLINIKPHEHVGSKQERNAAKEKAVQRMRERELQRRQQEASGLQQNFFASGAGSSKLVFNKGALGIGNLTMKDMYVKIPAAKLQPDTFKCLHGCPATVLPNPFNPAPVLPDLQTMTVVRVRLEDEQEENEGENEGDNSPRGNSEGGHLDGIEEVDSSEVNSPEVGTSTDPFNPTPVLPSLSARTVSSGAGSREGTEGVSPGPGASASPKPLSRATATSLSPLAQPSSVNSGGRSDGGSTGGSTLSSRTPLPPSPHVQPSSVNSGGRNDGGSTGGSTSSPQMPLPSSPLAQPVNTAGKKDRGHRRSARKKDRGVHGGSEGIEEGLEGNDGGHGGSEEILAGMEARVVGEGKDYIEVEIPSFHVFGAGGGTGGVEEHPGPAHTHSHECDQYQNAQLATKLFDSFKEFVAYVARQMKTINYQLSSQKCLEEGWTLRAPSPLDDELGDDVFVPEPLNPEMLEDGKQEKPLAFRPDSAALAKLLRERPLIEKYYESGQKFLTMFPDGTGNVFYPSGNLAILISAVKLGQYFYTIHQDMKRAPVVAAFEPNGYGYCYFPNGAVRMYIDQYGGLELDGNGGKRRKWSWKDQITHVHAPPFQPICIGLNRHMGVRVMSQENIALTFSASQRSCRFNMGARLKIVAPENAPLKEIEENHIFLEEKKNQVDAILDKVSNLLKFPNHPKLEKMLPPLHISSKATKTEKMKKDRQTFLAQQSARDKKQAPVQVN